MCETWLIHVWEMTYWCVRHDLIICETWLIHVWDMTSSCVWHDSFMYATWLIHVTDVPSTDHVPLHRVIHAWDMTLLGVRHDSFIARHDSCHGHIVNWSRPSSSPPSPSLPSRITGRSFSNIGPRPAILGICAKHRLVTHYNIFWDIGHMMREYVADYHILWDMCLWHSVTHHNTLWDIWHMMREYIADYDM